MENKGTTACVLKQEHLQALLETLVRVSVAIFIVVKGNLTVFEEDNSTSNCSSQVWSEQKMCRWCEPYQSQEWSVCDEDHGCGRNMHERQKSNWSEKE